MLKRSIGGFVLLALFSLGATCEGEKKKLDDSPGLRRRARPNYEEEKRESDNHPANMNTQNPFPGSQ